MKIGNHAPKPVSTEVANGVPATNDTAAGSAIPTTADASAKIELSNTASSLLSSGSSAEFDAAKVDRISKAIADGSFKINPEAIADKLISNATELLSNVEKA